MLLLKIVGWAFLGLGGFICVLNFFLSFLRHRLYRMRGREAEYRCVSGFPFLGTCLVVYSLFFALPLWAKITGIVVALLDTGGPHWFASSLVYQAKKAGSSQG